MPDRFDLRRAIDHVQPIRNRLNHWADVHLLPLLDKLPSLPRSAFPPNLSPRQQDIVEPLLQLAGLIGGPWPRRALEAFAIIFDVQTHFDLLPNIQLLADIRDCFGDYDNPERLSTTNLLDELNSLPARPWDTDGLLNAHKLDRLLKPFEIHPRNQRINKSTVQSKSKPARGYQLEDFQEAWKKHLNLETPQSETPNQDSQIANKDAVCNGVGFFADYAAKKRPPAGGSWCPQMGRVKYADVRIAHAPLCRTSPRQL